MAIDGGIVIATTVTAAATARYLARRGVAKNLEGALDLAGGAREARALAREAETPRAQLGHERQARDLERRMEKTVRALPPSVRREFERAQQALERDHGIDRER